MTTAEDTRLETRMARVDERTGYMVEKLDKLYEVVFTGNGHRSLLTRMSLLEDQLDVVKSQFNGFVVTCTECKRTIVAQSEVILQERVKAENVVLSRGRDIMAERADRAQSNSEVDDAAVTLAQSVIAQQTTVKTTSIVESLKTRQAIAALFVGALVTIVIELITHVIK